MPSSCPASSSARSQEGTSYHYAPPEVDLHTHPGLNRRILDVAGALGIDLIAGKHWTTDALYRETFSKLERLGARGVLSVDMELSALAGVAHYRGCDLSALLVVTDVASRSHTWADASAQLAQGAERAAQIAARLFLPDHP
ncbi:MAG: hypothetical protein ISS56_15525 [Anaerolineae bacterium]|nr:hypothetical protein [Anaerolineae bacterium]